MRREALNSDKLRFDRSKLVASSAVNDELQMKASVPRLDGIDVLRGLSILAVVLWPIWIRMHFVDVHLGADWPKLARRMHGL